MGHGWHQQVNHPMPSQLAGRMSCTFPWHMCDIACNCVVTYWQQFQSPRLELGCTYLGRSILYNMIIDMSSLQALPVELGWYVSDKVSSALSGCWIISIWYKASTVFQESYIVGLFHLVAHKIIYTSLCNWWSHGVWFVGTQEFRMWLSSHSHYESSCVGSRPR